MIEIAILGTRGVPARYSGFETMAEEIGERLVKRGFEVTVYCREGNADYKEKSCKGINLVVLPKVRHKYFETVLHTFISAIHVSFTKIKIVYFCNAINSCFLIIPKLFGKKVIINVNGLEWKRAKWNKIGKFAYRVSERLAALLADEIISDSKGIQNYYLTSYSRTSVFIPYGATRKELVNPQGMLEKYGLKKRRYLLYVARLEPENNAHIVIKAYEKVGTDMPLVIVGDAPYGKSYIKRLHSTKDPRIKFLKGVFGDDYNALQANSYLYIHGHEVGGTNPVLLEAMAFGGCALVNGISFNREVIADSGIWFKPGDPIDLKNKIEYLLKNPEEVEKYRVLAAERVEKYYNWEDVVTKYEGLCRRLIK